MLPKHGNGSRKSLTLPVSFPLPTGPSTLTANVPASPSCAGRLRNFSPTTKSDDDLLERPAWEGIAAESREADIPDKGGIAHVFRVRNTRLDSLPGAVLDQKYRIERELGKGAMGAVFQATHLGTSRTVAVKVIVPELAGRDEFLLRFQREAEAAGRLRHPNVVNVTDFGSATVDGEQLAYLVMEFLDGQNLSEFLRKNPRPASDRILDIVDQVALALDAAHESGIIHRDLKPDNIWLQPNHRGGFNVKVLDFGIAKLHNPVRAGSASIVAEPLAGTAAGTPAPESETVVKPALEAEPEECETVLTSTPVQPAASAAGSPRATGASSLETTVGSVLGTPAYMAPEQCQGANVGTSADIYSLAVISYQMFCGSLPFEAKSLADLLQKQIGELPMPPAERDRGISNRVSVAILSGLAKIPAARPPSAMGFAAQLRAATEAEVQLLADGQIVASNQENFLVPLALACFALYVPIIGTLYLAARTLSGTAIIPAGILAVAVQVLVFGVQFFLSQMYKAGSTLLLDEAAATGHFSRWQPHFSRLVHNLPALVRTHLANTFDPRPQSFLAGQLWPVVWASEGLSGKAALTRALYLARAETPAAAALAARQWGILLSTTLFAPFWMALFGVRLGGYGWILMGPMNAFGWFAIVYPAFLTLLLFRLFAPAFLFLYLSARRCHGERVNFTLPSVDRERRSRRSALVRPGTIAWFSLPVLMSIPLLYRQIQRDEPSRELLDAATDGRKAAALHALDSGLPVNWSDKQGWTPLMRAATRGNLALARELVARHANVNAQNSNGDTALLLALWNERSAQAEMLIASGSNVQTANEQGRTALFAAAMHGDAGICKLLLAHGADRTLRDEKGKTALDYAKEEGHSEVVKLLSR